MLSQALSPLVVSGSYIMLFNSICAFMSFPCVVHVFFVVFFFCLFCSILGLVLFVCCFVFACFLRNERERKYVVHLVGRTWKTMWEGNHKNILQEKKSIFTKKIKTGVNH